MTASATLVKSVKKMVKPAAVTSAEAEASAPQAAEPAPVLAAVPKAKTEKVEAAESLASDLIVVTAHEIETLTESKALKLVPQLLNDIDHDFFRLGGVLSAISANAWYMDQGYESFKAFVEASCGIQYRKAMYLISIYNGLVESGVQWEQVKHLGWTKLKELAAILTPDNVDEWVSIAENMTVLQLQEHIKAQTAGKSAKGEAVAGSPDVTTITFKLHPDQKVTIKEALAKCKHESGTEFDAVALEHICLDYLGGAKAPPKSLKELMAGRSIEEVLGVLGEVFPGVEMTFSVPEDKSAA